MEIEGRKLPKIVVATHNPAKIESYTRLLHQVTGEVISLIDLGIQEKPVEFADSPEGNVEIKCRFYNKITDLPVLCSDEALFADFLADEEQPGVYVRRIRGVEVSDEELFNFWEKRIKIVPKEKRTGRWHIA